MQIEYLADHPYFVSDIAQHLFDQFSYLNPHRTRENFHEGLKRHLNKTCLPVSFVALAEGKPLGTFSIKAHELEGYKHLSPWLGSVFVYPDRRRKGIGSALVEKATSVCKQFSFQQCYLFTPDKENWYAKFGWRVIEKTLFNGYPVSIMSINL